MTGACSKTSESSSSQKRLTCVKNHFRRRNRGASDDRGVFNDDHIQNRVSLVYQACQRRHLAAATSSSERDQKKPAGHRRTERRYSLSTPVAQLRDAHVDNDKEALLPVQGIVKNNHRVEKEVGTSTAPTIISISNSLSPPQVPFNSALYSTPETPSPALSTSLSLRPRQRPSHFDPNTPPSPITGPFPDFPSSSPMPTPQPSYSPFASVPPSASISVASDSPIVEGTTGIIPPTVTTVTSTDILPSPSDSPSPDVPLPPVTSDSPPPLTTPHDTDIYRTIMPPPSPLPPIDPTLFPSRPTPQPSNPTLQPSSPVVVITSTLTTTSFVTTTSLSHIQTSTVISSGMLNPNFPARGVGSSFARNAGAIAGITVGASIALLFAGFWLFFAWRRRRQKGLGFRDGSPSASQPINFAPDENGRNNGGYRLSLEGESEMDLGGGELPVMTMSSTDNARDITGIANSSGAHLMRNPSFGQAGETMATTNGESVNGISESNRMEIDPPGSPGIEPGYWLSARDFMNNNTTTTATATQSDPNDVEKTSSVPASLSSRGNSTSNVDEFGIGNSSDKLMMGSQSLASQQQQQQTQQMQQMSSVSSHGHMSSLGRNSSFGRPISLAQSPVPPTSYTFRERERETPPTESPTSTLRGILGRLRMGRVSNPTIVVQGASSSAAESRESLTLRTPLHVPPARTPSSLLHPSPTQSMFPPASILRPPPPAASRNSMNMGPPPPREAGPSSLGGERRRHFWPGAEPLTISSPPSPAPSERSRDLEGLLHPRMMFRLAGNQDSSASLRDDEDYSRPIGGFVHNGIHHSTTTFDTHSIAAVTEPES